MRTKDSKRTMKATVPGALLILLAALGPAGAGSEPARITFPLDDHHALTARIEAAAQAGQAADHQAPRHDLIRAELKVTLDGERATIESRFDVEVAGLPREPVSLAIIGIAASATVEPSNRGASLHRPAAETLVLIAPEAGRYRVSVRSAADLEGGRLSVPAIIASSRISRSSRWPWQRTSGRWSKAADRPVCLPIQVPSFTATSWRWCTPTRPSP